MNLNKFSSGSLEEWRKAITEIVHYPAYLVISVALCAPLATTLLKTPFTVRWWSPHAMGKTTLLRIAASVWGAPVTVEDEPYSTAWDEAAKAFEHIGVLLPELVDEGVVKSTLYRKSSVVKLVVGEHHFAGQTELTVYGSPFDDRTDDTAKKLSQLMVILEHNHGVSGPAFVSALSERFGWPDTIGCSRARDLYSRFYALLKKHEGAGRVTPHLAVLELTAELMHEILDIPIGKVMS